MSGGATSMTSRAIPLIRRDGSSSSHRVSWLSASDMTNGPPSASSSASRPSSSKVIGAGAGAASSTSTGASGSANCDPGSLTGNLIKLLSQSRSSRSLNCSSSVMKSVSKSNENTSTGRSDAFRNVTAVETISENGKMGPTSTREGSNLSLAAMPLPVKAIVEVTGELATLSGNRNEQGRSSTGANSTATLTFSEGFRTPFLGVRVKRCASLALPMGLLKSHSAGTGDTLCSWT